MDHILLLIILLSGFYIPSCCVLREYHFVNLNKTWNEAQSYCREKYTDLATIENMDDVKSLKALNYEGKFVWFGLHDDPKSWMGTIGHDVNSWRWSTVDVQIKTEYHNWASGQPNYKSNTQLCVSISPDGFWFNYRCELKIYFLCYDDRNGVQQKYILVEERLSWKAAQQHCRRHYTDLAVIKNAEENNQVESLLLKDKAQWIGLHRVAWTWSDQSNLSFTYWMRGQPYSRTGNDHCGMVDTHEQFTWNDGNCIVKRTFFCHRAVQEVKVMRMKIETDADMTNPDINEQLQQQLHVRESLANQGVTNFQLRWKTQPTKQESPEDEEQDCKSTTSQ